MRERELLAELVEQIADESTGVCPGCQESVTVHDPDCPLKAARALLAETPATRLVAAKVEFDDYARRVGWKGSSIALLWQGWQAAHGLLHCEEASE